MDVRKYMVLFRKILQDQGKNESTDTINGSKKYKSLRPKVINGLLSLWLSWLDSKKYAHEL